MPQNKQLRFDNPLSYKEYRMKSNNYICYNCSPHPPHYTDVSQMQDICQ